MSSQAEVPAPKPEMFKELYKDASKKAPWDVGAPQPRVVQAEQEGLFKGDILDAGAGLGDNTVFLASKAYQVTAFDFSPEAVQEAQARLAAARETGQPADATFVVADALDLGATFGQRQFDTVLDSALFHVFGDAHRRQYIKSLTPQVKQGGRLLLLAFSDKNPDPWKGPCRISEADLKEEFYAGTGWAIESISPAKYAHNLHEGGGEAVFMVANKL